MKTVTMAAKPKRVTVKSLFPMKVNITAKMIENADIYDSLKCIGARTLRKAMKSNMQLVSSRYDAISWGGTYGTLLSKSGKEIVITTEENINMMDMHDPTTVTLIIVK